jgi:hypothetical protein
LNSHLSNKAYLTAIKVTAAMRCVLHLKITEVRGKM